MPKAEDTLVAELESHPSIQLAVLFGSGARGELRPGSDLDVGVLGVSPSDLGALEAALARAAACQVDLVALDAAPPLLRFEIAKDGRVLLERAPYAWSDFKARAMVDWWDWAPIARRFHRAAAARLREQVARGSA